MVACCCRAGRLADAQQLLEIISDDGYRKRSTVAVAEALAAAGPIHDAVAFATARLSGNDLHQFLANAYRRAGQWKKAETAAGQIDDKYSRIATLAQIGAAMARAGEPRAALLFRKAARQAAAADVDAMAIVVSALVDCGRLDEAWETGRSLAPSLQTTKLLLDVAAPLARAGDQRGIDFLHQVWQACAAQKEREPFLLMLAALPRAGMADSTLDLANWLLRQTGLQSWERYRIRESLAEAGHLREAIRNLEIDGLDDYLEAVALLVMKAGGADQVIEESIRVAGWVRADWQRLSSRFPDCAEAHGESVL